MAEEVKEEVVVEEEQHEEPKKKGLFGKVKSAILPDAEEQAAIISTFVRITVLAWSGGILTLNYVAIPGVPQQKIDPTFMIQSIKKHIKIEMKRQQRDFRIIFDGETFHLNEGKKTIVEDVKGITHRVTLYRNEIQHYKDGRISFHYHKEMEVFPNKMPGGFVYTLTAEYGPEVHLLVYDQGSNLQEVAKKYINIWIENYEVNDAQFETEKFK